MRYHAPRCRSLAGWIGRLAVALIALGLPAEGAAQSGQKEVLVLYSVGRDAQIAVVGDRDLPGILSRGLNDGVDYYSEFIDPSTYARGNYAVAFPNYLRLKYEGQRFDLIVAMDYQALQLLEQVRLELFAGTPIVFFSSRPVPTPLPNSTGIIALMNLRDTLTLATTLQPELRHVFVVSGTDRSYEQVAKVQFEAFAPRLDFTYLSGLATQDLEARLATLPKYSMVYYLHLARDGANDSFNPLQYLSRITSIANAPTYCWVDSAMGRGIVGGSLRSLDRQVDEVGRLALRVLRGEAADSIPSSLLDLNVQQVDWRELKRWDISEEHVPSGVAIRLRPPSIWGQYRGYILAVLAVLVAQSTLITALVVQRLRRRQAEAQAQRSQLELRTSYERIRDLGARLLTAQDTERARIARELHDDVSQQMALLEIDLTLAGRSGDAGGELVEAAMRRTQLISKTVHDLSHRLHPAKLRLIGLVCALQGLQQEVSKNGPVVVFTHDDVPVTLPLDLTLCLFRVAQEALQNAVKYGQSRQVSMSLTGATSQLVLTIVDDGPGFDVTEAWGKGLGLVSMSERLEAIGGTLEIRSSPHTGTRVEARVPFDPSR